MGGGLCLTTSLYAHGQGFVYDQQSANAPEKTNYDSFALYIQPLMQAFVPTLSSIGFVQLELMDYPDTSTTGARIGVALYSGSPSAPTLLGTTDLLYLPPNFNNDQIGYSGVADFTFAAPVALTPGQTYFLEPDEVTGDDVWSVAVTDNTYQYGQLYGDGHPFTPPVDLWFREGVTVPEPPDCALLTMAGLLIAGILGKKPHSTTTTVDTILIN
jgi:hypothetical protein